MAKTIIGLFYEIMVKHPTWDFNKVLRETVVRKLQQNAETFDIGNEEIDNTTVTITISLGKDAIDGLKELYEFWHRDNVPELGRAILLHFADEYPII